MGICPTCKIDVRQCTCNGKEDCSHCGQQMGSNATAYKWGKMILENQLVLASKAKRERKTSVRMTPVLTFQQRVEKWVLHCFGKEIAENKVERNLRFLEEALELVQSLNMPKEDALKVVDYVYGRDIGDPPQEVGGVMVCLAALCTASDIDMRASAEIEIATCWDKSELIRSKQAAKPKSVLSGNA